MKVTQKSIDEAWYAGQELLTVKREREAAVNALDKVRALERKFRSWSQDKDDHWAEAADEILYALGEARRG